jgi:hypothetical protein
MSLLSKTLIAASVTVILAGTAHAQSEPWVLRQNMGYVVDSQGRTMIVDLGKMDSKAMKKAKVVPRGTVMFVQDGKLMMMMDRNTAAMPQ